MRIWTGMMQKSFLQIMATTKPMCFGLLLAVKLKFGKLKLCSCIRSRCRRLIKLQQFWDAEIFVLLLYL